MTQETQVRECHLCHIMICHIMDLSMPAPHPSSTLQEAFENQDEVFAAAFAILHEAINQKAFPAASIAVTHGGSLVALKALGRVTPEAGAPSFSRSLREEPALSLPKGGDFDLKSTTLFDLASLTKVIATTTTAMLLYERGLLDLEAPISAIVPEFTTNAAKDPRRQEVTLRMLLAHSSGLPAHEKFFLKARTRDELLQAAFTTPLAANPATRAEYSDIGFIILGVALERLADEPLDTFCQREAFGPLAMTHTTFNPAKALREGIPPSADDRTFRHRTIQGEVQDENANVLGGVAPHAGLFSTADDLALFAHAMLNGGYPILRPETVNL